jgi:hypothetical protein
VGGGAAKRVILTRKGEQVDVVFWFSDGRSRHSSASKYWLQTTLRHLTMDRASPEPVMAILWSSGSENLDWTEVFDRFPVVFDL